MEAIRRGLRTPWAAQQAAFFSFCGPAASSIASRGGPWEGAGAEPAELCPTIRPALQGRASPWKRVRRQAEAGAGLLEMLGDGSASAPRSGLFPRPSPKAAGGNGRRVRALGLPEKPDFSQAAAKRAGRTNESSSRKSRGGTGLGCCTASASRKRTGSPRPGKEDVGRVVIGGEITSLEEWR